MMPRIEPGGNADNPRHDRRPVRGETRAPQSVHRADNRTRTSVRAARDGCQQFDMLVPQEDQSRVLLVEAWRDQAALDVHSTTSTLAKTREDLSAMAPRLQSDALHRG